MTASDDLVNARRVRIPFGRQIGGYLEGSLDIPSAAHNLVVLMRPAGNCRFHAEARRIAGVLKEAGDATLLLDLLSFEEEQLDHITKHLRSDERLLSQRMSAVMAWLACEESTRGLSLRIVDVDKGEEWVEETCDAYQSQVPLLASF